MPKSTAASAEGSGDPLVPGSLPEVSPPLLGSQQGFVCVGVSVCDLMCVPTWACVCVYVHAPGAECACRALGTHSVCVLGSGTWWPRSCPWGG